MEHISDRVNALAPSQTLAMSQKSQELKARGVDSYQSLCWRTRF